jgi:hypothetical protein
MKYNFYKIVVSHQANDLSEKVNNFIKDGWTPKGSHKVVETIHQCQYSGAKLMRTMIESKYSQTMVK